ncbi:hypothetical protein B0T10DRAFT_595287 [Thelonectria olida]|uniref:Myb-like DNA-binding domain-containing protein n=1 Tax=Thelonectria olida TaxID=1576542 RepID=A0A9P8W8M3_9HYPO|nr:hypothetical protein B0T10DRAFT_595287 [Thelonectria olida]
MSKTEPADQVKFLAVCISHTTNGRPDFQLVADELSIVSKAAAQKRYERLLKSYGIKPGGGSTASAAGTPVASEKKAAVRKTPVKTPRKRKQAADDDDGSPPATPTPASVKKRTRTPRAKKEDTDDEETKPKVEGPEQEAESETKQTDESVASRESSLSAAPSSEED